MSNPKPKTLENLIKAFIGESQARNRYTFYASKARKEGYEQIAEIFTLTAENEKEHAETLYELALELCESLRLNIRSLMVEAAAPLALGNTIDNLRAAIEGENFEHTKMYPEYARVAEEEGYPLIAARLRAIAKAEEHHEERFKKLLKELEEGTVFRKKEKVWWVCRKCGYVHYGNEPPEKCPSCGHARNYFQVKCEEY